MNQANSASEIIPGYGLTWGYGKDQASLWAVLDPIEAKSCQWLLDKAITKYPGYAWFVQMRNGLITCRNFSLAPDYGFHLRHEDSDNDGQVFVRFCGELLERFGQNTGKMDFAAIMDAKRDVRGAIRRLDK